MRKKGEHIVQTLRDEGFTAFFAGGWVRDLLLNIPSQDIDIATDATPDEVMSLFEKTIPIGKAFGVVLVVLGEISFEVATFRCDNAYVDGRRPTEITFSSPEEDAKRRDFTINGLFYDPFTKECLDYVGGLEDLEKKRLRSIGDPYARLEEDKLRMLRAVRFSTRFHFTLEKNLEQAILAYRHKLFPAVSGERVWQELKKMHEDPSFVQSLFLLKALGLLEEIFPPLVDLTTEALREKVCPLLHQTTRYPLTFSLALFFTETPPKKALSYLSRLNISNQEKIEFLFALFAFSLSKDQPLDNVTWVRLLADPQYKLIHPLWLKKSGFTQEEVEAKQKELEGPIQRKRQGTTLLRAKELKEAGIAPGKLMGHLLHEAERLATEHKFTTKEQTLQALQKTTAWPL